MPLPCRPSGSGLRSPEMPPSASATSTCSPAGANRAPSSASSRRSPTRRRLRTPMPSSCPAAIPSFTPAETVGGCKLPLGTASRAAARRADLWRVRRLHGAWARQSSMPREHRTPWPAFLPHTTSFAEPRLTLGYRTLEHREPASLSRPSCAATSSTTQRSHRQRRRRACSPCADAAGASLGDRGIRIGRVMGSYAHVIDGEDAR